MTKFTCCDQPFALHISRLSDFCRGSSFRVCCTPPLDQILTTSEQLSGLLLLRSLINGPTIRVRFWESLVVKLYSEIDQIHLSIEAQCVTTLLPLGDCHITYMLTLKSYDPDIQITSAVFTHDLF